MKKMKSLLLISAFLSLSAAGCAEDQTQSSRTEMTQDSGVVTETVTETTAEELTETNSTAEAQRGINPLTGESGYPVEAAGKRPVAVMVNNLRNSYPQYGTSQADVMYEMLVEGGITRMMAVYADYSRVPDVGSVRSSRYYYPKIAAGMDAIYCHWGAEQVHAAETMERLKIDRFDGGKLENSILFYRDPERIGVYSSEHTGYLRGSEIPAAIERFGIRWDSVSQEPLFTFAQMPRIPAESACTAVTLSFSNASSSAFFYDEASGTYLMHHGSEPQMDGHAGTQLAYTNVFVLQTQVGFLDEANYLRDISLDGGNGYYISNGGMESIRWEKPNDLSPIICYSADGSELLVNQGKSYIGIIGDTEPLKFETE